MIDEASPTPNIGDLSPNDQKMMSPAPADDVDDPEKPEFELTPEVENQIMAMVKDIVNGETPYTSVTKLSDAARLKPIFAQGLLGVSRDRDKQDCIDSEKGHRVEIWKKYTRDKRNTEVNFNINYPDDINDPMSRMNEESIAITFDLSSYRDTSIEYALNLPRLHGFIPKAPTTHKTFRVNDPREIFRIQMRGGATGKLYPSLDCGFVIAHRIPPREFDGVMIPTAANPQEFISAITAVYAEMNEPFALPIYNKAGNLLWPQQMTHEEVIKFVEEHDKEKTHSDPDLPTAETSEIPEE
jgi:hypothetical protein